MGKYPNIQLFIEEAMAAVAEVADDEKKHQAPEPVTVTSEPVAAAAEVVDEKKDHAPEPMTVTPEAAAVAAVEEPPVQPQIPNEERSFAARLAELERKMELLMQRLPEIHEAA